jgi:hypothetical protein
MPDSLKRLCYEYYSNEHSAVNACCSVVTVYTSGYDLVAEDSKVDSSYEYEQNIAAINGTGKYSYDTGICNKFG